MHLVDLDDGTVLLTVEGRSARVLLDALAAQGVEWLAGVEEVAIDPFTPYAKAIRQLVPHARLVDKFHILRLFSRAVDQVRRRTIRQAEGRRGRKVDLMWRTRMPAETLRPADRGAGGTGPGPPSAWRTSSER